MGNCKAYYGSADDKDDWGSTSGEGDDMEDGDSREDVIKTNEVLWKQKFIKKSVSRIQEDVIHYKYKLAKGCFWKLK